MKRHTRRTRRETPPPVSPPDSTERPADDDTDLWDRLANDNECEDLLPPPPSDHPDSRLRRALAQVELLWQAAEPPSTVQRDLSGAAESAEVQLLASLWPFSELPAAVLVELAGCMGRRGYAGGERLIHQGSRSRHLLIVTGGAVEVHVQTGRRRHVLARLGRGAILGEMGLVTDTPCTATVTAVGPVEVAAISTRHFRRLAARFPVLACSLSHLVASRLGQAPLDTLAGKVLHGYRLRRCVGRGGMGVVYEARRLADGERVALKMLSHRFAYDLDVQKRFEREIQICRLLSHASIPRILDHFTAFGTNFMAMEFRDGVTLDEVIRASGPMDEDAVRAITSQLATALAYIHRHGVCHRDVKPRNVMVSADRSAVSLLDFGLATSLASCELTRYGCILGTPRYMPPEQLAGRPVDYRADVYAMGCVVYEMLAGEPLLAEGDVVAAVSRQPDWSLPPAEAIRPGLSPDLYEFLRQSVAPDPEERVADLAEIAACWSRASVRR